MNYIPAVVRITPGMEVMLNDKKGRVVGVVDLGSVHVMDYQTGRVTIANIDDLRPLIEPPKSSPAMEALSEAKKNLALRRFKWIEPLVDVQGRNRKLVLERAQEIGVNPATLYKWLRVYESTRLLTSLASGSRVDKGSSRLAPEIESIIWEVINAEYLTLQKKNVKLIFEAIKIKCLEKKVAPPHYNTVRSRLKRIPRKIEIKKRRGQKEAQDKFSPIKKKFENARWPLSILQIDHSQLDIILVDAQNRAPVGRPWITMAIDVFSRMVAGYYISFDHPGAFSTGCCLVHAMLPKDNWLAEHGIKDEWPVWGKPACIHADNAKEFRGNMLEMACKQYNISLEFRPVRQPRYGGHIERLFGTISKQIHALPGSTFSNSQERGCYNSNEKASFTLEEFESWLGTFIVQIYHKRVHSSLRMPPIEKFKKGILGDGRQPGVGLPPRIIDEDRLRLDFMPFAERTVQRYGIVLDGVHYWHDVLRPWIDATDPLNPRLKRKFFVRRDPRDISRVWFFDPELQAYLEVPYRDTSHPSINVLELREARRKLSADGQKGADEGMLYKAIGILRQKQASAVQETKKMRRARERKKLHLGVMPKLVKNNEVSDLSEFVMSKDFSEIQPFEEMDDLS